MTSPDENGTDLVRTKRFNAALDKFLELIDDKATTDNFQMALPDLKPKVLESARKRIVNELKDAIKEEKKRLVQSYQLEEKLAELEVLVREAEVRQGNKADKLHDVWRPNLDFTTTLYSRSIPSQRESITRLEEELSAIEADNKDLMTQLEETLTREEDLRLEACATLSCLEQSIAALESNSEGSFLYKETIHRILQDLGPRSVPLVQLS